VEEVDLSSDMNDWESMTSTERDYILSVLGFFAASDGIVVENLVTTFCAEVQIPEARCFYGFQTAIENIHSEMYSLMIDKFAGSPEKKEKLFHAVVHHQATKAKAEWALAYIQPNVPKDAHINDRVRDFSIRCLACACVEGIMFSSSFASLFWLKNRGLCPGLTFSNEKISVDEGLHRDFAVELLKMCPRLEREKIYEVVESAVDVELLFVRQTLPTRLKGINNESMTAYVKFVADHLLTSLGYPKKYNVANPYSWMEAISLDGKTNFFERRVSEYSMANVGTQITGFSTDADF
jgi:ribonucleotide reductase beta subunit family protein with ferritin-like domain